MNKKQLEIMHNGKGFIAALDQSGGSTPKALSVYGIKKEAYSNEEEMFELVHEMRTRIIKSKEFSSKKILGSILFENTMDKKIDGLYTADFLWEKKGILPILKIDKGLTGEQNGVRKFKPIPNLDNLLSRAVDRHIFVTKERTVINSANAKGIREIVEEQFEIGKRIASYGLVPILEPEVTITIKDKAEAEDILKAELIRSLNNLPKETKLIFKLSLPTKAGLYDDLSNDPHVVRVVALSGGYSQDKANSLLKRNRGMIASFSRALTQGLTVNLSDEEFEAMIKISIDKIYDASVNKESQ